MIVRWLSWRLPVRSSPLPHVITLGTCVLTASWQELPAAALIDGECQFQFSQNQQWSLVAPAPDSRSSCAGEGRAVGRGPSSPEGLWGPWGPSPHPPEQSPSLPTPQDSVCDTYHRGARWPRTGVQAQTCPRAKSSCVCTAVWSLGDLLGKGVSHCSGPVSSEDQGTGWAGSA